MKFKSVIQLDGKTATGIPVPEEIVEKLGAGKRPKVLVKIGDYTYQSSIASMDGIYKLPISAAHREGAGVAAGDEVEVDIELDTSTRTVNVPEDLQTLLDKNPKAKAAYEALSYSKKRLIVEPIEQAKTPETRQRRIDKAVESLLSG
ncbi:MAG: DUF1905 domain-containing protein [Anaerolineaceae bacterium]|nr:DUF1905 domain-containing protein [Anaerolineaceae bacterium]